MYVDQKSAMSPSWNLTSDTKCLIVDKTTNKKSNIGNFFELKSKEVEPRQRLNKI